MAVSYDQLIHNTAIRVNALVGSTSAALATSYNVSPLTAGEFNTADFPFGAIKDAVLMAEEIFALAIAENRNHIWRAYIAGATSSLANAAQLPTTSSVAKPIIGVWGAVRDASDNTELTPKPVATVQRVRAETWRLQTPYYFAIDGNRIWHTRTNVIIDCCVYSRTDQAALINSTPLSAMLLPDVLEGPISALAVGLLTRDSVFAEQAVYFSAQAEKVLAGIKPNAA